MSLELWEKKLDPNDVEKINLVLHDIIQLMNDDHVAFALRIPSSAPDARRGSMARRASRGGLPKPEPSGIQLVEQTHRRLSMAVDATSNMSALADKLTFANLMPEPSARQGSGRRASIAFASETIELELGGKTPSGVSTPVGQSKPSSSRNSTDLLNSIGSDKVMEEDLPAVIPVTPIFVGSESGSMMVFEIMIEVNPHDRTKRVHFILNRHFILSIRC